MTCPIEVSISSSTVQLMGIYRFRLFVYSFFLLLLFFFRYRFVRCCGLEIGAICIRLVSWDDAKCGGNCWPVCSDVEAEGKGMGIAPS